MYVFLFFVVVCALYIPFALKMIKKKQADSAAYAAANPTASKVYTRVGLGGLFSSERVKVYTLNQAEPPNFYDGMKEGEGFFALPGKSVIEVEYASTRPGILHKSVTTRTGAVKQEIDVEASKRYRLGYNPDAEHFVLTEF